MKLYVTGAFGRHFQFVLAAALPFLAAGAGHAQTTMEEKPMEELVVTGIRGSLDRSMDIRRNESGVVDSITALDIGKFPDTNLAESLQRITGVSIDRQKNEGNQITVRGLGPSFNMVTLNGRQMPVASSPEQESIASATQSRAFNFAEIASESVTGVNVY
jgi:TonB-dependent receptor